MALRHVAGGTPFGLAVETSMQVNIFVVMAGRNAGGPETYEHELVRQLADLDRGVDYNVICFNRQAADSFRLQRSNLRYQILPPSNRVWGMSVSLPVLLKKNPADVLHAAFMAPPRAPDNTVFTLHCSSMFMRPELYPPLVRYRLKALTRSGMRRARHIICVSHNVMQMAAEYYRMPMEKMSVVYNGVGQHFRPAPVSDQLAVLQRYQLQKPFLLFVGRLEPRKNLVRVLKAFADYRRRSNSPLKLVLAGNKTWDAAAVDQVIAELNLAAAVVEAGHVANTDLPALYSAAEAFVFPSLWEGFGIPVIEAMACGCPVLTSNCSSLPEIAGDAAVLVDPLSVTEVAAGLERILSDQQLRADMRARGLARAEQFSWRRTAEQTLDVYRKVA